MFTQEFNIFASVKRKIIAILFLSLLISSSTEWLQLLKIPVLVQHFIEHKREDDKISFIAFLKMHYRATPIKDKDYDRDMQLPFKTDNCVFLALTFFHQKHGIEIVNHEQIISTKHSLYKDDFNTSQVLKTIWQPPRLS
jgi:hypothetical protein